jgi:Flp pilus assembly pilin Flp
MKSYVLLLGAETGQDIAEYAVMLALILVLVVGTIRLIGSNANNVFSSLPVPSSSGCMRSSQLSTKLINCLPESRSEAERIVISSCK